MTAPAHVITLGLDGRMNQNIRDWFEQFKFMPPLGLISVQVETIAQHAPFTHLLKSIAASPHNNFIIIIHGHEDGSGLWLKLTEYQGKPHTSHFDLQRLMDLDAGGPPMSHSDYAIMGIGPKEINDILELRHRVLEKRIHC